MNQAEEIIRAQLLQMQDREYQAFQQKLLPTLDPERILGVRVPQLRRYAKSLAGGGLEGPFCSAAPHYYYEENALQGFLIERERDFAAALGRVEAFLPSVDNWAVCDSMSPPVFGAHRAELLTAIRRWLGAEHPYTVRYGLGMLMRYFLEEDFREEYLEWAGAVQSGEYYIKMMQAWFFATALAKQPAAASPWFEKGRLEEWVRAKAIQKALESRRISLQQKAALRALRQL